MINSYCGSLDDTFAQWVYIGLIKEEDAQCFSVQSSIKAGSFVLAAAAVLLALINTFVNKAATQYFRDGQEVERRASVAIVEGEDSSVARSVDTEMKGRIQPVPVLFTDTFRWLMESQNPTTSNWFDESSDDIREINKESFDTDASEDSYERPPKSGNIENEDEHVESLSSMMDVESDAASQAQVNSDLDDWNSSRAGSNDGMEDWNDGLSSRGSIII